MRQMYRDMFEKHGIFAGQVYADKYLIVYRDFLLKNPHLEAKDQKWEEGTPWLIYVTKGKGGLFPDITVHNFDQQTVPKQVTKPDGTAVIVNEPFQCNKVTLEQFLKLIEGAKGGKAGRSDKTDS